METSKNNNLEELKDFLEQFQYLSQLPNNNN